MSKVLCNSCGYLGEIDTYKPNFSGMADCRCPDCGSTNNAHNDEHLARINKAWNCKHKDFKLTPRGNAGNGEPLLECEECGSIGLDWSMRGEPMPQEPKP